MMQQQDMTAKQRMTLQIANQRRALLAGKAKVSTAFRQLDAAANTLDIAAKDLQRGEIIDLDLPNIIAQIKELAGLLQDAEKHIDRHIERKHL